MSFWSIIKNRKKSSLENEKGSFTFKERLNALKNLPKFFKLVWSECPKLTLANLSLRLIRAFQPLAVLLVAKMIMDKVVMMVDNGGKGDYTEIVVLVVIELGLGILNDVLGRCIALIDGLIGDAFANLTSIKMMQHAANLDMYHFEDPVFYDKLERARRQTLNRSLLTSQVFAQAQELITLFALAIGLASFNFWLILLLIVSGIP